ncbi:MAG: OadG family protein [Deltaproteobacteria bacterium]|nr:OadG family protein [Deltaproteobacteria bacterium]
MLAQAFELLLLGMGAVFAFLSLLVLVMSAMPAVLGRLAPPSPDDLTPSGLLTEPAVPDGEALAVAIAAARDASARRTPGD